MMDFARALTVSSLARYLVWKVSKPGLPVALELRSGVKFLMRQDRSENNDYGAAYEVFIHQFYNVPHSLDATRVRFVADLGGNVGYSVLHWLNVFPNAVVETFEPNPDHAAQLRRNLDHAGEAGRVTLNAAAAGASERTLRFVSRGMSTSAFHPSDMPGKVFETTVLDVFEKFRGKRIDLMKMDIEGGEYELLEDPRFRDLDLDHLIMEWHTRTNEKEDRAWCEDRLAKMGFAIRSLHSEATHGMLWATRALTPA